MMTFITRVQYWFLFLIVRFFFMFPMVPWHFPVFMGKVSQLADATKRGGVVVSLLKEKGYREGSSKPNGRKLGADCFLSVNTLWLLFSPLIKLILLHLEGSRTVYSQKKRKQNSSVLQLTSYYHQSFCIYLYTTKQKKNQRRRIKKKLTKRIGSVQARNQHRPCFGERKQSNVRTYSSSQQQGTIAHYTHLSFYLPWHSQLCNRPRREWNYLRFSKGIRWSHLFIWHIAMQMHI